MKYSISFLFMPSLIIITLRGFVVYNVAAADLFENLTFSTLPLMEKTEPSENLHRRSIDLIDVFNRLNLFLKIELMRKLGSHPRAKRGGPEKRYNPLDHPRRLAVSLWMRN